ncbi:MAG: PilN domain-containing protein [bacterium]|nr:PilN domain-containing protein [bacterium]
MKTLLNLLPEENKKSVQRKLHFRFFLWQLFLVCALEVFYLSILMSIYFILDFQLQSLQTVEQQYERAYTEQRTLDVYQKKFKDTNVTAEMVGRIEHSHFSFTQIFFLLETLLPEGIAVDRLTTKNYTVMLSGRAAARDDILAFESNLKKEPCVKNVNVPLSNLFSQKDIDFQIDFEMRKECLQNNIL